MTCDGFQNNNNISKDNQIILLFLFCLVFLFCLTKVYRNSIGMETEVQGGAWNYISIIFFVFSVAMILLKGKRRPLLIPILFSCFFWVISWINGFFWLENINLSTVYNYLMIPYFVMVLTSFYYGCPNSIKNTTKKVCSFMITFFLVYNLYTYLLYWTESSIQIMLNNSYYCICLLPLVFFLRDEKLFWINYFLICIISILSTKRAGILALVVASLVYYLINYDLKNKRKFIIKKTFKIIFAMFCSFMLASYIDDNLELGLARRFSVLFTGGGSGRDIIYNDIWGGIINSDFIELFLGHGNGSIMSYGTSNGYYSSAHNDFLNIFYENGIIPVLLIICFYAGMVNCLHRMIKMKYFGSGAFGASLVIAGFLSMFSAFLDSYTFVTCCAAYWGIELAIWVSYCRYGRVES